MKLLLVNFYLFHPSVVCKSCLAHIRYPDLICHFPHRLGPVIPIFLSLSCSCSYSSFDEWKSLVIISGHNHHVALPGVVLPALPCPACLSLCILSLISSSPASRIDGFQSLFGSLCSPMVSPSGIPCWDEAGWLAGWLACCDGFAAAEHSFSGVVQGTCCCCVW